MIGSYIGIVVPIHNTAKYLPQCIDSILNQTFANFKLVLCEDSSSDDSFDICNKYLNNDNRIKVMHLNNVGVSEARNKGLRVLFDDPQITHIAFVDSDDCIENNFLEVLLDLINTYDSDISMCSFDRFEEEIFTNNINKKCITEFDNNSFWLGNYSGGCESVLWNKLYKIEVIKNIVFPPHKIHEDEFVIHRIVENATKICSTNQILYHYRKRPGSIMSSSNSQKSCDDLIEAILDRIVFFQNCKKIPEIKYNTIVNILNYIHKQNAKETRGKLKEIKKLYKKDRKSFSFKQRLIITMKFSRKLSFLLWKN